MERRAKAEAIRLSEQNAKDKERLRREREEKKKFDEIAKEQKMAMQARQAAEKARLAGIQAMMADTKKQIETMYAEGQVAKQALLMGQAEAVKEQRERQRKEAAEKEAEVAELQRQLATTRTKHQAETRKLLADQQAAIAAMAADLESKGSALWNASNLPVHQMPRLKGFSLSAPKTSIESCAAFAI